MRQLVPAVVRSPAAVRRIVEEQPIRHRSQSLHPALRFQREAGNRAIRVLLGIPVQPELTISEPGNADEQEADRIADAVMRAPEISTPADALASLPQEHVQRLCAECRKEEERRLPRKAKTDRVPEMPSGSAMGQSLMPGWGQQDGQRVPGRMLPLQVPRSRSELQTMLPGVLGPGVPLPRPLRTFFESRFGYDFSWVRIHAGAPAAQTAHRLNARAFTIAGDVVFGSDHPALETEEGRRLLAHELTHVVQQNQTTATSSTPHVQRRILPEDVSAEMVGLRFQVTGPFTVGPIQLSGGEMVDVVSWDNMAPTVRVQLPVPYLHAGTPFDVPKRLIRPMPPAAPGIAPYGAGLAQVLRDIERGERAIAREQTRRGGPRPGEPQRLEGLQRNRERLLNRRLIQEAMFNRFDPAIRQWTDFYNQQFGHTGTRALDPNLVKSMFFQETQLGTAGEHLEDPFETPPRVKTRFNIAQVIDSSAQALLIMMQDMQGALITTHHLENIRGDLANAQQELRTLRSVPSPTPAQVGRLAELSRLSGQNWEVFLWEYRASGQSTGFSEAVTDFFASVGTGQPPRNLDYEFWIRTAIRWLFEKRRGVGSWAEAIRAYNGSGERARHYREAVTRRAQAATTAHRGGREFVPENM